MSWAAFETLGLIAVGRQRGDDLEAVAETCLESVDALLQRRSAGHTLEHADRCRPAFRTPLP